MTSFFTDESVLSPAFLFVLTGLVDGRLLCKTSPKPWEEGAEEGGLLSSDALLAFLRAGRGKASNESYDGNDQVTIATKEGKTAPFYPLTGSRVVPRSPF